MRGKSRFLYMLVLLLCIHPGVGILNGAEIDSRAGLEIPIFQSGYDISKVLDPSTDEMTVTYHVQAVYPAAEVLEFYDAYFNGRGWISSFETCQRDWMDLGNKAQVGMPAARLLFASWEHAGSNQKVLLWIRYESRADGQPDDVVVEYHLQPITEQ